VNGVNSTPRSSASLVAYPLPACSPLRDERDQFAGHYGRNRAVDAVKVSLDLARRRMETGDANVLVLRSRPICKQQSGE
jgi:hypothetical protein